MPLSSSTADSPAGTLEPATETMLRDREREEAFEALLREHGGALQRVAASYEADPELRDDLYQEICLAIWKALPSFRGDASVRTFLFRIAHNRGLSHGWREGRVPKPLEEPEALPDPTDSPEDAVDRSRRRARLLSAIRRLPLGARQVLTLRLEGLSFKEIAEVTGLTENNAMVRASRARKALKEILETE